MTPRVWFLLWIVANYKSERLAESCKHLLNTIGMVKYNVQVLCKKRPPDQLGREHSEQRGKVLWKKSQSQYSSKFTISKDLGLTVSLIWNCVISNLVSCSVFYASCFKVIFTFVLVCYLYIVSSCVVSVFPNKDYCCLIKTTMAPLLNCKLVGILGCDRLVGAQFSLIAWMIGKNYSMYMLLIPNFA